MSKKKVYLEIEYCDQCPHFDSFYYDYKRECTKLKRIIPLRKFEETSHIPDDCPLEDVPVIIKLNQPIDDAYEDKNNEN